MYVLVCVFRFFFVGSLSVRAVKEFEGRGRVGGCAAGGFGGWLLIGPSWVRGGGDDHSQIRGVSFLGVQRAHGDWAGRALRTRGGLRWGGEVMERRGSLWAEELGSLSWGVG